MGNTVTAAGEYCKRLGVPEKSQGKFKNDVLDEVIGNLRVDPITGADLSDATHDILALVARNFVQKYRLWNYQRQLDPGRLSRDLPTESESIAWLQELLKIWIDEKLKQESQEDPSYTASGAGTPPQNTTKKRKRPSGSFSTPYKPDAKLNKYFVKAANPSAIASRNDKAGGLFISTELNQSQPVTHPLRSATVESGPGTVYDIDSMADYEDEHLSEDSDGFESLTAIMSSRKPRSRHERGVSSQRSITPPTANKGKAPVRDPPGGQSTEQITTGRVSPRTPSNKKAIATRRSEYELDDDVSTQSPSESQSVNSDRLSDTEQAPTQTPSHQYDEPEPQHQTPSSPVSKSTALLSPPPTTRHAKFASRILSPSLPLQPTATTTTTDSLITPVSAMGPTPPGVSERETRLLTLLDQITSYIDKCASHNQAIATNPTSSAREVQFHSIRAMAFATLKDDIDDRIQAVLNDDDDDDHDGKSEERKGKRVRSFCLHA